jgi:hypothetical protein
MDREPAARHLPSGMDADDHRESAPGIEKLISRQPQC